MLSGLLFQYLMKLHYSQTKQFIGVIKNPVSVPYEITLLSNYPNDISFMSMVSVPYEITLLSNGVSVPVNGSTVSVPYEITLLSNFYASDIS